MRLLQKESLDMDPQKCKNCAPRFRVIDSEITTALIENTTVRAVYAACLTVFVFHAFLNIFKYFLDPEVATSDLRYLRHAFAPIPVLVAYEIVMTSTFIIILLPGVQFNRTSLKFIAGAVFSILPLYIRFSYDVHVVAAIFITLEQLRYVMKAISLIVECKDSKASVASTLYFLFTPVMIYQHNYPKKRIRDWKAILCWLIEIILISWSALTIVNQHFISSFIHIGLRETTAQDIYNMLVSSSFYAPCVFIGMNYAFMHCWNNIWGELMHFGDRTFQKNFLSTSNPFDVARNQNILVHAWIKRYLLTPAHSLTGNRILAIIYAFTVSMAFHDYFVAIPLKIWTFNLTFQTIAMGSAAPFLYFLSKLLQKHFGGWHPNMSSLPFVIIGAPLVIMMYASKYFWQLNCKDQSFTFIEMMSPTPVFRTC